MHGTEVVLSRAAVKQKRVIIASTSEVYGKSTRVPFSEEDDLTLGATLHSRWAYACSKALDEWLALAYWREKAVPVTICRFFNTVGPRQTGWYGMVVPTSWPRRSRVRPSRSTARASRPVASRMSPTCVARLMVTEAAIGHVFDVSTDHKVTITQLAEVVRNTAGSTSEILRVPYDQAYAQGLEDTQRRVPNCDKLERTIGFRPKTSLETMWPM